MFTHSGPSSSSRFGELNKWGLFEVAEQVSVTVICFEWSLITELMLDLKTLSSASEELGLANAYKLHDTTTQAHLRKGSSVVGCSQEKVQ